MRKKSKLKVLAIVHAFPPEHGSGAEWMLHDMFQYLKGAGHTADVMVTKIKPYDFNGIRVVSEMTKDEMMGYDVIVSHLGQTGLAMNTARAINKPFVFIAHNTHRYGVVEAKRQDTYIIYNSQYVQGALWEFYGHHPSIIVRPPTDIDHYRVNSKREKITLINMNDLKGGVHFRAIASKMKDRQFLGVMGAYGDQITEQPANVEIMRNMEDIRVAYRKTKILLMPSRYETWGRTAVEAMSSGIPVICHGTPGLMESCGSAGYFVPLNHLDGWIQAIKDVESNYKEWSEKSKFRAQELHEQSRRELAGFSQFLLDIVNGKWKKFT